MWLSFMRGVRAAAGPVVLALLGRRRHRDVSRDSCERSVQGTLCDSYMPVWCTCGVRRKLGYQSLVHAGVHSIAEELQSRRSRRGDVRVSE